MYAMTDRPRTLIRQFCLQTFTGAQLWFELIGNFFHVEASLQSPSFFFSRAVHTWQSCFLPQHLLMAHNALQRLQTRQRSPRTNIKMTSSRLSPHPVHLQLFILYGFCVWSEWQYYFVWSEWQYYFVWSEWQYYCTHVYQFVVIFMFFRC